jgi:two-component system chemotaxis response regulator CheY
VSFGLLAGADRTVVAVTVTNGAVPRTFSTILSIDGTALRPRRQQAGRFDHTPVPEYINVDNITKAFIWTFHEQLTRNRMSDVLIADDSEFMRNLLKEILEEDHTIIGEVENGVEAVEAYEEVNPDLVMMDIVMPIQDGIEATDEIKTDHPDATIIMCTSVGQEEKMKEAVKAGADGYITKPFQKPSVMEAIEDVVAT